MSEWKEYKSEKLGNYIKDIAAGPFGSNLKVECFVPEGFPIIDGANLKGFKVTDNVSKFVTEEKARSLHRAIAKRNDVVVTISGNVGQISYIPKDSAYEEYLVSQRQFRVTFDTTRVFVPYLVYYFHTHEGQYKILSFANQTGVPALSQPLKNFRNIDIVLPPLSTQRRISSILSSLDDKIAINRRICENLEAQAQALFKHWFIDFAPFKNGKFVESELGMIPEGCRVGTLGEICTTNKRTLSSKNIPDVIEYLDTGNITANKIDDIQILHKGQDKIPSRAKRLVSEGDVIFSSVRPNQRHYGLLMNPSPFLVVSTGFVVITASWSGYRYFIYSFLIQNSIIETLQAIGEQSVSTYPSINANDIESLKIIIPRMEDIEDFADICCNFYCKIESLVQESSRLSFLRDTLLPKLMSGEIKV